jgi:ribosome-associated protein
MGRGVASATVLATTKKTAVRKPATKATKRTRKAAAPAEPQAPVVLAVDPNEPPVWLTAARAADSKKALDIQVLDLREVTSFADFFVICTGTNSRQVQAIAEEIDVELRKTGYNAASLEGFKNGEWILSDYGDMIVHVFSPAARSFYDLERLWRHAKQVEIPKE